MSQAGRLRLALRLLARDWRAGELRVLLFGIVIAVAASTAIGLFTDRIAGGVTNQSAELLGADLVLVSPRPVDDAWLAQAAGMDVAVSRSLEFASVVLSGEALLLSAVKAVDAGFPLRGDLRTAAAPFADDMAAQGIPAPGEAWADARLLTRMERSVGDSVEIGNRRFTVTRVLTFEPGQLGEVFGVAPRLLINLDEVPATGVVQPGSRVSYQYLFAGNEAAVARFRTWLEPRLGPSHEMVAVREGRRAVGNAIERAERYLGLAVMVAVVLAGAAIAMAARRYSERHFDVGAMLRCLGASQNDVLGLFLPQLIVIGLLASVAGMALGWFVQHGLYWLLAELLPPQPGAYRAGPLLAGFATGMIALTGFALPPVLRLRRVPPLRVLRRELLPIPNSAWLVYGAAGTAIVVLLWRYTGSWGLTVAVMAGAAAALAVLGALAASLLLVARRVNRRVGVAWRFGLNNLWRRPQVSVGQILSFGLALMAMAVVAVVRTELLDTWRAQLPDDVPNHFAINILPEDLDAVTRFFDTQGIETSQLYPMVRGRLVTINGMPVNQVVSKEARRNNALQRELNLTWTDTLQADNRIVRGRWWTAQDTGKALVSVESQLAERLGIEMGDRLGFRIGGEALYAHVASIRSVQWDSFRPNFYMVFPPGVLADLPVTYMNSFRLDQFRKTALVDLVRAFPAITVLELDRIIEQVGRIFRQVTLAVEYVLVFVLLAGMAVLYAALQASLDERFYDGALLRTLGASRRQLRSGHLAEFAALGALAGLVAAIATESLTALLYTQVMGLDYAFQWPVWLLAPLAGALLLGGAGYWGTRVVVERSPLSVLRRL